jgi:hypothetical protein
MVREAEGQGQRRADANPLAPGAWDASACAPRAAEADVESPGHPALPDGDAGKLADLELDAQGRDEHRRLVLRLAEQVLRAAAAVLCRPGAARSAGQSSAAREVAEGQKLAAQAGGAQSPEAVLTRSPKAQKLEAPLQQAEAAPDAVGSLGVQSGSAERSASPRPAIRLRDEPALQMALLPAAVVQLAAELAGQREAPQPASPLRAERLGEPVEVTQLLSAA